MYIVHNIIMVRVDCRILDSQSGLITINIIKTRPTVVILFSWCPLVIIILHNKQHVTDLV
jgi:hypothetical protein